MSEYWERAADELEGADQAHEESWPFAVAGCNCLECEPTALGDRLQELGIYCDSCGEIKAAELAFCGACLADDLNICPYCGDLKSVEFPMCEGCSEQMFRHYYPVAVAR